MDLTRYPVVPGYRLIASLGRLAYLARDESGLRRVVKVAVGPGPDAELLRREGRILAGLDHPHIVRLVDRVEGDEIDALVLEYASGGSLADRVSQGMLATPGQVVTIGWPIAAALDTLHSLGIVHGDVSPANIVVDEAGKPILVDFGFAAALGELAPPRGVTEGFSDGAGRPTASGDVFGLATTLRFAATGRSGARAPRPDAGARELALVELIAAACEPEPTARPSAAEFADRLRTVAPPEPVDPLRSVSAPAPRRAVTVTRRVSAPPPSGTGDGAAGTALPAAGSNRRRRVMIAGVALAAALAGGAAYAAPRIFPAGGSEPAAIAPVSPTPASPAPASPTQASPTPAQHPDDWAGVLAELDRQRSRAFESGDASILDRVYLPGSAPHRTDRATLAELAKAGGSIRGLESTIVSATLLSPATLPAPATSVSPATPAGQNGSVQLAVTDRLSPHVVVDAAGKEDPRPGRGERRWVMTLAAYENGWRISAIRAAPPASLTAPDR